MQARMQPPAQLPPQARPISVPAPTPAAAASDAASTAATPPAVSPPASRPTPAPAPLSAHPLPRDSSSLFGAALCPLPPCFRTATHAPALARNVPPTKLPQPCSRKNLSPHPCIRTCPLRCTP